jgi:hypothetical protein
MSEIEHHLLTIQPDSGMYLHGFIMTNDKRVITQTIERMFNIAESHGSRPLPVVLDTRLSDDVGVDAVLACLKANFPKAYRTYQRAKNSHLTVFAMASSHPWSERLMNLH